MNIRKKAGDNPVTMLLYLFVKYCTSPIEVLYFTY